MDRNKLSTAKIHGKVEIRRATCSITNYFYLFQDLMILLHRQTKGKFIKILNNIIKLSLSHYLVLN